MVALRIEDCVPGGIAPEFSSGSKQAGFPPPRLVPGVAAGSAPRRDRSRTYSPSRQTARPVGVSRNRLEELALARSISNHPSSRSRQPSGAVSYRHEHDARHPNSLQRTKVRSGSPQVAAPAVVTSRKQASQGVGVGFFSQTFNRVACGFGLFLMLAVMFLCGHHPAARTHSSGGEVFAHKGESLAAIARQSYPDVPEQTVVPELMKINSLTTLIVPADQIIHLL